MKARDFVLVAAVLLLGGLAAADALRGRGSGAPETSPTTAPSAVVNAKRRTGTLAGTRLGRLGGRLVYSVPENGCTVSEVDLASGTILPIPPLRTTCAIVSAARGERVAFTLPSPKRDLMPYRVVDLNHAAVDLAGFQALNGTVRWSPDGQKIAWCVPGGRGRELEIGLAPRQLAACPVGYTHGGRLVFAHGHRLVAGGRTVAVASGRIVDASLAADGSLAAVLRDGRLMLFPRGPNGRVAQGRTVDVRPDPPRVLAAPTGCAVAAVGPDFGVAVLPLRTCPGVRAPDRFRGHAAAWSPDGRWLAVAEDHEIVVHPVAVPGGAIRLRASAVDLAWKD